MDYSKKTKKELIEMLKARETREKIFKPSDVYIKCLEPYADEPQEHFIVICLNTINEVVHTECVSKGLVNKTLIHPREVFRPAIMHGATAIIVAHNHPSGSVEPSPTDKESTERLIQAGEILGIPIRDHIIFSYKAFFSFCAANLLFGNKKNDSNGKTENKEDDCSQDSPLNDLRKSIAEQRGKLQDIVNALDKEIEGIKKIQATDKEQHQERQEVLDSTD